MKFTNSFFLFLSGIYFFGMFLASDPNLEPKTIHPLMAVAGIIWGGYCLTRKGAMK